MIRGLDRSVGQNSHIVETPDPSPRASRAIGERVRDLRGQRQWTLETLAERSGVSRAMLSKIERAETSPTIAVAARVASALGIGLSELIQQPSARARAFVTRRADRLEFRDPKTGFVRELVSPPFENRRFELVHHALPKDASTGLLPPYPRGVEKQVVVEKGNLNVHVAGEIFSLNPGDGLFFEADVEHEFENSGRGECRYYLVVGAPPRG